MEPQAITYAVMYAIMVVGGLGLVAGAVLAVASEKFAVEVDPRVENIEAALPGVNCGVCGYPSCSSAAKEIVAGKAPINSCVAGGEATMHLVAEVMGVKAESVAPRVAKIQCRGDIGIAKLQYEYHGINDCRAAYILFNGAKTCSYGCLALGTCAKECPFDAIEYEFHRVPSVNYERCTGCGVCVDVCPRNLIDLYDASHNIFVMCKSHDKGGTVKKICEVGCIACGACERSCPFNAITVQDGLAVVDHMKCTSCGLCVMICPQKCIWRKPKEGRAFITNECNGCTICGQICPVNAIEGERKELHSVVPDRCIACGICVGKCPRNAMEIRERKSILVETV